MDVECGDSVEVAVPREREMRRMVTDNCRPSRGEMGR